MFGIRAPAGFAAFRAFGEEEDIHGLNGQIKPAFSVISLRKEGEGSK